MFKPIIAAFAALAFSSSIAVPVAALAQDVPSYAQPGAEDAQIRGRVAGFDGAYALSVRDDKGYVDNVQLHDGTIINPTGLTLAPGMVVSILGYNQGSTFSANEIDTPYTFQDGGYYYGGHPWNYYGPTVGLSFFFGNAGWWHGGYFRGGGYSYNGGVRVYNSIHVHNIYRQNAPGGAFHGRTFVAPREGGGYHAQAHAVHEGGHGGGEHGAHR